MKQTKEKLKTDNLRWILSGVILVVVSMILRWWSGTNENAAEWYAQTIYPLLVETIGRITSLFPFSFMEFGGYFLILIILFVLLYNWRRPVWILSRLIGLAGVISFWFTIACGIQYDRLDFASQLDWEIRDSAPEELLELCVMLTEKLNETEKELSIMEKAEEISDWEIYWGREEYTEQSVKAMKHLQKSYPMFAGYIPQPKPFTYSKILSIVQLAGISCPYTLEANYNADMEPYNIPHTICHEITHIKGFMREDEANFIGYLACIQSDSEVLRYSGYMMGWLYATNALYTVPQVMKQDGNSVTGAEAYRELMDRLNERSLIDFEENSRFWDQYEGRAAETANQVNDTYLKLNRQEDGVKSYGRAVDLMLAFERQKKH